MPDEEKVDGYRMAAMKAGDGTRLISRNGIQHTKRFPELVQALNSLLAALPRGSPCRRWDSRPTHF